MAQGSTWIRTEELDLARVIAQENLEKANQVQQMVVPRQSFYTKVGKRCLDIFFSAIALIITSPINLILAVATFFDVGSPIIFKQKRTGKDMETFTIVKFRNMTNETDENGELLPPAQRVTKMGRVVRKYSIDELLNFWSIFKGDMSLIGPRPLPEEYNARLSERHKQRYAVRPGLECPMTKETIEKYPFPEKFSRYHAQFENDVWYVQNVSFATDVKLAFRLVQMVLEMKQRSKNASSASPFLGYDDEGRAVSRSFFEKACAVVESKV